MFGERMGGGSRAEAKAIILREARVQWGWGWIQDMMFKITFIEI